MKKIKWIILFVAGVCVLVVGFFFTNSYDFVLKNHSIQELINESFATSLDENASVIYEVDTIKGFDRDGERYLILDYSSSDIGDIEENFVKESDSSFENEVSKILYEIDIDNKYLPSFTDDYYSKEIDYSNRDDKLYLIYFPEKKQLYALAYYI